MNRCFAKYIEQGKRMTKLHNLIEELEKLIDDPSKRSHILKLLLGYIFMHYNGIARTICFPYNNLLILFPDFVGYTFVFKIFCDQILQEAAIVPPTLPLL